MYINGRSYAERPPRGDTLRRGARRGDLLESPPPREGHELYGRPRAATRYERAEASPVTVAPDTDTELIRFSGRPDTVTLIAHDFAAVFTFVDFVGRTITEYLVDAFGVHDTHLAADRILVRNHVAASAAHVQAIGKWAERYEAT